MTRFFRAALALPLALLLAAPAPAPAQTLRDRIAAGSAKAADAVKKGAQAVDQTVASTIELARPGDTPQMTRDKLDAMAADTLEQLFARYPEAQAQFDQSAGYAVFDTRRATVVGVVAGFGKGVAVDRTTQTRTYMGMGTGGVGLAFGFGGFESQVLILFETTAGFEDFVFNGYDATAQAGSTVGEQKLEEGLRFVDGRSIFVLNKKGLRVGASAAGTKYWPIADLN